MVDPRIPGFASNSSHEFLVSSHSYKIQVKICHKKIYNSPYLTTLITFLLDVVGWAWPAATQTLILPSPAGLGKKRRKTGMGKHMVWDKNSLLGEGKRQKWSKGNNSPPPTRRATILQAGATLKGRSFSVPVFTGDHDLVALCCM